MWTRKRRSNNKLNFQNRSRSFRIDPNIQNRSGKFQNRSKISESFQYFRMHVALMGHRSQWPSVDFLFLGQSVDFFCGFLTHCGYGVDSLFLWMSTSWIVFFLWISMLLCVDCCFLLATSTATVHTESQTYSTLCTVLQTRSRITLTY